MAIDDPLATRWRASLQIRLMIADTELPA